MPNDTTTTGSVSSEGLLRGAGNVMAYVRQFFRVLNGIDVRGPRG